MKYFTKWYTAQNQKMRDFVKELVSTGRLNLVNGGWSAPDETVTNYEDLLSNFMIGHRFLQQEFGQTPTISWQIDTFGISSTWARLARDVGFEALFFSRNDIQEKHQQRKDKSRI